RILKLLFDLAHWHGLAKLRLHTDASLDILSQATTSLSNSLQNFQDKTCSMFQTRELKRERDARQRRSEKKTAKCGARPPATSSDSTGEPMVAVNHETGPTPASMAPSNNARKPKFLSLNTYTYHAL